MLVVFLKGVNVGGRRTFRPSVLAQDLTDLDVTSIGAAGTFVVRRRVSHAILRAEFVRRLPFEPEIVICTAREMMKAVAAHPFDDQPSGPAVVPFVSILAQRPRVLPPVPLSMPGEDWIVRLIAIQGRFAFGVYRRHMRAISYLGQLEKRLGVPLTTRNWNTIRSILKVLNIL